MFKPEDKPSKSDIKENNSFISDLLGAKFIFKDYKTFAQMRSIKFDIMEKIYEGNKEDVLEEWEGYIK